MSVVKSIFLKETKGFFKSPSFYIVAFLVTGIMSWVFPIVLSEFATQLASMRFQQGVPGQAGNIHYAVFLRHLSNLNLILIFVVPALTMRLLAEEKKMRTMDLLMTTPITSLHIVLGKFLAATTAVFFICLLALSYPVATSVMASFYWMPLLVAFLGIFLTGVVYVSMNLFCSAMTSSSILAYVMAVILNIGVWFVGLGVEVADSSWARSVFEHISLNAHLIGLVEGVVRTSSLVFLVSLIGLFIFLCERVIEASRWRS